MIILLTYLQGVLIFLVLICNKPVLSRIQRRVRGDTATGNTDGIQVTVEQGDTALPVTLIQMAVDQEQLSSSAREREADTQM